MSHFKNISLQLRLTLLTMVFLTGISGILLLLTNRNTTMQMTSMAVPLEKIYISTDMGEPEATTAAQEMPSAAGDTAKFSFEPSNLSEGHYSVTVKDKNLMEEHVTFTQITKAEKARIVLNSTAQDMRQFSYYAFAVLIIIGGICVYFWCGRVLQPVRHLSDQMHKRTVNNLNQPIENENAVAEMKQLSDAFNHMIFNLNQSFEVQKQFNANAAHELRTPIAVLQANLEVLTEEEVPSAEDCRNFVQIAQRTIGRMNSLVESLLQMTRLEDSIQFHEVDIKTLIQSAVSEVQLAAKAKEVSVQTHFADEECWLNGDETLLFTAVYNLIENAVKYNQQKGSVCVNLALEEDRVSITVSDTGIGICAEELESVFQPFYRVDQSRARGLGGAGMGLSLVKNIIKRHGGEVCLKSETGMGSCFEIWLPAYSDCHE